MSGDLEFDGEIVAEEDAEPREATEPVRRLPARPEEGGSSLPVLSSEVRNAAIVAAGGVLAGAATVAAVRAVSHAASRTRVPRGLPRRRGSRERVVASRSFLVDVHLLGR